MRRLQPHRRPLQPERRKPGARNTAQAIEASLRFAPIRIEHAHAEIMRVVARGEQQQPVAPHRTGAIRKRHGNPRPGRIVERHRTRVDHRKIVARAMAFDEVEPHARRHSGFTRSARPCFARPRSARHSVVAREGAAAVTSARYTRFRAWPAPRPGRAKRAVTRPSRSPPRPAPVQPRYRRSRATAPPRQH